MRLCVVAVAMLLVACAEPPVEDTPLAAGLRISQVLGDDLLANEGYSRATQPRSFQFPADHGAHPDYRSEWWYFTSVLEDANGNEYGVQFTLFRQALSPQPTGSGPWHNAQVYLAHLAISDVSAGRHYHSQRFSRGHPQLAGVTTAPAFRAHIEDWELFAPKPPRLSQALPDLRLQAAGVHADGADEFAVALHYSPQQAPAAQIVLQGDAGLSRKGPEAASYYYSVPRIHTSGTLRIGARDGKPKEVAVSGLSWLDREWSTSLLGDHLQGWDWFALQLYDGRSVMVFNLRRKDGALDPYNHGLIVPAGTPATGAARHLNAHGYRLTPVRYWRDANGVSWPVAWQLLLHPATAGQSGELLEIEALLDDQLMQLGIVYWEGLVSVAADGVDVGRGYMELTGYDG